MIMNSLKNSCVSNSCISTLKYFFPYCDYVAKELVEGSKSCLYDLEEI